MMNIQHKDPVYGVWGWREDGPEDQSSVPSVSVQGLTTTCNYSSKRPDALFWSLLALQPQAQTHTKTGLERQISYYNRLEIINRFIYGNWIDREGIADKKNKEKMTTDLEK